MKQRIIILIAAMFLGFNSLAQNNKQAFTIGDSSFLLNGKPLQYRLEKGYAVLDRSWKKGDKISLQLPMDVKRIVANENVKDDKNRFALQRGPVMYCLEGPDNNDAAVMNIVVEKDEPVQAVYKPGIK